jgi:hypothetical protein
MSGSSAMSCIGDAARICKLLSQEVAELQHPQKFTQEEDAAEMRETCL